jgi:Rrf2 family transcriptional regulator, cysteine metabolism repressor
MMGKGWVMKISTKGRYGLRIMLELALQHGTGPVQVATVARNQELPGKYIHVLVGGLKSAGLVQAVRGPSGGLTLARDPSAITVLDVVTALEGPLSAVECTLDAGASCGRAPGCVARDVWCELAQAMEDVLRRHTLADLASKHRAAGLGASAWSI